MNFGSLFSGIGGFDLAFERVGMKCSWQCEIDPKANEILKKHFGKEIHLDVRNINSKTATPVELICGGFPCQDLSLAGHRKGLDGDRSGLWFEFARILGDLKPKWVVVENVPGLLSSNKGKDFEIVLNQMVELGYGVSWRILDAQYFGVAQRRRRVFIVGSLGNGSSSKVLFEPQSLPRNSEQGRKKRERNSSDPAISLTLANSNRNGPYHSQGIAQTLDTFGQATTFTIRSGKEGGGKGYLGFEEGAMTLGGQEQYLFRMLGFGDYKKDEVASAMKARDYKDTTDIVCWEMQHASEVVRESGNISPTLQARMGTGGNNVPLIGVRKLTPTECERLQGFPDGWTEGQTDATRYKQLGNAVAVPVVQWIGNQIINVERGLV